MSGQAWDTSLRCEYGRRHVDPYEVIEPPEGADDLTKWCYRVICGAAGMNSFEVHEIVVWVQPDDRLDAAMWVLRCLGNDLSPETQAVVDAIVARRAERGEAA